MLNRHNWTEVLAFALRWAQGYNKGLVRAPPMILSFILALLARETAFSWTPSLDLSDNEIRSALIPGVQY